MSAGRLLLAATPLGRPEDASARLVAALAGADVIAAEDTRRVRALAAALEVVPAGRVLSFFDGNESDRVPRVLAELTDGATVLLVSDAGMPLISDPGYRLVTACVAAGVAVTCLPGPSAVTTALAVSGLPADRFCFEGFAPRRAVARTAWLHTLAAETRTAVFFESPRRLPETLAAAVGVLGPDRRVVVCRELTKTHEEVLRGTLGELADWSAAGVRGEITVVLAAAERQHETADLVVRALVLIDAGSGVKDACAQVAAEVPGASRRELYDAVLATRRDG